MKKILKILGIIILGLIIILFGVLAYLKISSINTSEENLALLGAEAKIITENGFKFRDLNKNGKLDIYEDNRKTIKERVEDLLSQMNIEEKAGQMFMTIILMEENGELSETVSFKNPMSFFMSIFLKTNSEMLVKLKMGHFNIIQTFATEIIAKWNNNIQKMAEKTRLGIPIVISTDPRHAAGKNIGANVSSEHFSKWPSSLGLAATRDTNLVREFGDIARQEYLATGIKVALHPMADLATEPRWGRIDGTFGEDAELSAKMTKAYVLGFQGEELNENSVFCMTKHFSGGGPQKDGEDPHFPYGKEQAYPGDNFNYHLIPFEKGAFPAKTAQIMPYYGIPVGQTNEDVAFAFNKTIITKMLREKYKFDGIVCTDWAIITDSKLGEARAWGVEKLTPSERVKKVIDAGCDMFGGEAIPHLIVELVKKGEITEERINKSIRRILRDKFKMGLFDNPYLDIKKSKQIAGNKNFIQKGKIAQRKSLVLLKNNKNILPLKKEAKVFIKNFNADIAKTYANIVNSPNEADFIILKLKTPYDKRDKYFLEKFFHQGRLTFNEEEKTEILNLMKIKPTILVITLERPAVIPEINKNCEALIADFSTEDDVIFDIIFGKHNPNGKLPFELPSSAEAVKNQLTDVPYDSENPLYKFGAGISY